MAYRYYSTLRPLMVGGIPFPKRPGESITTIVNFEEGRTNIEDAEITNQKFSCVCGRSIPKLTWDPVKHCYTM